MLEWQRQYLTAIIGLVITFFLSFVSDFLLGLPRETAWVIFSFGVVVTITATLLEFKFKEVIQDELAKIRMLSLLSQIDDPELYQLAHRTLQECVSKIEEYTKGVIAISDLAYMTNWIDRSQNSYLATFWASTLSDLYKIRATPSGRNYYEANVRAVQRGVVIKRIFLLRRDSVLGNTEALPKVRSILNTQKQAGVNVRVAWIDDLETLPDAYKLHQDFAIVDGKRVAVQLYSAGNFQPGSLMVTDKKKISEYEHIFQKIWHLSRPLEEFFQEIENSLEIDPPSMNTA